MKRKVWAKVEYFPNEEVPQVTFYRRSRTPKNQVLSNGVHVMWVDYENDNSSTKYEESENGEFVPTFAYIDAYIAVDENRAVYDKSYYTC